MSKDVIPDGTAEITACGFIMLFVYWVITKIGNLISWLSSGQMQWSSFLPDGVVHFFSMPFHLWFLVISGIVIILSFFASVLNLLGRRKETLLVPIVFAIPLLVIWIFIGNIYGFKIYFSEFGFFSSIGIGLKTMWNASIGFFSAHSEGISWINLTIGFIMLGLILAFILIAICQLICAGLNKIGLTYLAEEGTADEIKDIAIYFLIWIFILWIISSVGGILWLIIT